MADVSELLAFWNRWSDDSELIVKFSAAVVQVSYGILNENANTPNHDARIVYAKAVLAERKTSAKIYGEQQYTLALSIDPELQAGGRALPDAKILAIVAKQVDKLTAANRTASVVES